MSKPTPIADTVGSDKANQGSTSVTKSTLVKRHLRVPYARRADPYPDPSSVATFERASSAVLQTLSWPQKQFNKWIAADIKSSVQAAEKDLVTLDDPFQALTLQSQMSSNTSATIDAPAPAEIRIFSEASQITAGHGMYPDSACMSTLKSSQVRPRPTIVHCDMIATRSTTTTQGLSTSSRAMHRHHRAMLICFSPHLVKQKLCQRYSSTGTNLTVLPSRRDRPLPG